MRKKFAVICAIVVILAVAIIGTLLGISGVEKEQELFKTEFTKTIIVENRVAQAEKVEQDILIEEADSYVLNAKWEANRPGLLTGCTISDSNGRIIFASTAESCTMDSAPIEMEKGIYKLSLYFLASEEQWDAFLDEAQMYFEDWDPGDQEYEFASEGQFTISYSFELGKQRTGYYSLGVITGIAVGTVIGILFLIIFLKTTKTDGSIKCKYDERQEIVRGKGFKYAFFTVLIYNFAVACVAVAFEKLPIDSSGLLMLGAIVGLLVYVTYAIWNEAYFSLNENPKKVMIALAFIGLFNLALGIMQMVEGRFLENGVLTYRSINFFIGVVFVIIFIVLAVKQICQKREED